jgi:hypothetical protein
VATKNVTFKLGDIQLLAQEHFPAVREEEWAPVCRHTKDVEEEYMTRQHEIASWRESL